MGHSTSSGINRTGAIEGNGGGRAVNRDLVSTLERVYSDNRALEGSGLPFQNSPEFTVRNFIDEVGEQDAARTIASLVNQAAWDGRISNSNKEWARNVEGALTADEANRKGVRTDRIHKAHLDQIATEMRRRSEARQVGNNNFGQQVMRRNNRSR